MAYPSDSDYQKQSYETEFAPAAVALTNVAADATTGRDIDASSYPRKQQFTCTLSVGNMIINIPSDGRDGQVFQFRLTASGAARTVSFESGIIGPVLNAGGVIASGKTRVIEIEFDGTEWFCTVDREESAAAPGIAPKVVYCFPLALSSLSTGDLVTTFTPGFAGTIDKLDYIALVVTTDVDADATLNAEIGTTNVTGGVVTLSDVNAAVKGAVVAGSSVTAANTFTATDTISIENVTTNAFADGSGLIVLTCTQTA